MCPEVRKCPQCRIACTIFVRCISNFSVYEHAFHLHRPNEKIPQVILIRTESLSPGVYTGCKSSIINIVDHGGKRLPLIIRRVNGGSRRRLTCGGTGRTALLITPSCIADVPIDPEISATRIHFLEARLWTTSRSPTIVKLVTTSAFAGEPGPTHADFSFAMLSFVIVQQSQKSYRLGGDLLPNSRAKNCPERRW